MSELLNCPECNGLYVKNMFKDTCDKCFREEEKKFEEVYAFLRKRENRAASIERVVEVTGVREKLIHKWVRKKRLQPAHFPNMGYPCDNCGKIIPKAKLCDECTSNLTQDLQKLASETAFQEKKNKDRQSAYYSK
ncbi:TIGR03826 family flagellar region protein [Rossellomorea vietnamensis]|uniref:TIGR03826 family flagellar region protein n=1 Tax=Rossellomorea vietnamensis TaxID=218284 RepID=UPI003CF85A5E